MPPLSQRKEAQLCHDLYKLRRRLDEDTETREDLDPDHHDREIGQLYNRAIRYEDGLYDIMKEAAEKPPPPPRDLRRPKARGEPAERAPNFHTNFKEDDLPSGRIRRQERHEREQRREMERVNRERIQAREEFDRRHEHDRERATETLDKAKRAQRELRDFLEKRERQLRREEDREARERRRARERRHAAADPAPPPPYQSVETLPRYQEEAEGQTYEERPQRETPARTAVSELVTAQLQSLNLR